MPSGFFSFCSAVILIIGITLGFLAQQKQQAPPLSPKPCQRDPILEIPDGESSFAIDPCHAFSETYYEARQKFRHAAEQVQAELHSLPVLISVDGEGDDLYTIDIAVLRQSEKDEGLFVHTSGVHGVEGYAGSSIQIAFLESIYPKWKKSQKKLPTIVLIHAVNPYGMANYRRTNEHNVDLNRNGLHLDEWEQVVREPTGIYEPYEQFTDFFNPHVAPTWLDAFVGLWAKASIPLVKNGFDTLKAAMVMGQYYNAKGIFYGGEQLEPSLSILWDFFQHTLLTNNNEDSGVLKGPVTWIDVHTGLGKSGQDTLLMHPEPSSGSFQEHMQTFFPGAKIPQLSHDAKAVQKGYDNSKGITPSFFSRLFEQQHSYLGMVQEFGTVPGVLVAHALILENQAYHHLPSAEAVEWANVTTRRAFYKQTEGWRRSILQRGLHLLFQAIHRSSSLPPIDSTDMAQERD